MSFSMAGTLISSSPRVPYVNRTHNLPFNGHIITGSSHQHRVTLSFLLPRTRLSVGNEDQLNCIPLHCRHRIRIRCCNQVRAIEASVNQKELQVRRCSPILESELLTDNVSVVSGEWVAVPDIWRTSAEKFPDRVALVDQYHNPPSKLTYKELEQEILDFSEGLRVVGVNPDEKIALFADNSCRWLISDQAIMATGAINVVRGSRSSVDELLQIYSHSDSLGKRSCAQIVNFRVHIILSRNLKVHTSMEYLSSVALVVDSAELFNQMEESFCSQATMKFIILLWGEKSGLGAEVLNTFSVYTYKEIVDLGCKGRRSLLDSGDARQYRYEAISSDNVATLVYTSGTTGNPKGVMLTHGNLLHQVRNLWDAVPVKAGDRFLSMLPPWHAYERAAEYFIFTHGIEQAYTTVKHLKEDLKKYQPHYLISVPLVFETLYSGVQKQISAASPLSKVIAYVFIKVSMTFMELQRIYEGKYLSKTEQQPSYLISLLDGLWARTLAAILWPIHALAKKILYSKIRSAIGISKAGISGGGSLPSHVDRFFEALGILVQNGYGLTETSPVVACRHPSCNVLGSVGRPLQHVEVQVVDPGSKKDVPSGTRGIVKVRGPLVMKGYYKNPVATKQILDENGWLDTGDLGWIAPHHSRGRSRLCGGVLVLEGRAKDTIVLTTGENVEPSEIETAALRSMFIQQIVVIGQDKRRLGAIIVPNREEALAAAKQLSIVEANCSELGKEALTNLLREELGKWTSGCPFQVGPILLVDEPFTIDNGLMTPTLKVRRDRVTKKYQDQVDNMYI